MTTPSRRPTAELQALAKLFYDSWQALGDIREVNPEEVPATPRGLLWHDEHMTVTVESHHGGPVDVRVLALQITESHYARKILLTRQTDAAVVLYGIVRLNMAYLGQDIRREIESQRLPLGRVLINHNVLRHVRPLSLWQVDPAAELQRLFHLAGPACCYGRTAFIYCNGLPAVELLEIVGPDPATISSSSSSASAAAEPSVA